MLVKASVTQNGLKKFHNLQNFTNVST